MARITVGPSSDHATLNFEASLAKNSDFEINVGEGRDMSVRQIKVLERNADEIAGSLIRFDKVLNSVIANEQDAAKRNQLEFEASKFRKGITAATQEKRWSSISMTGLLSAAAAIGGAATPLVELSAKIVELLKTIYAA